MSERVSILLKAFPDIPTWEWLDELASREMSREFAVPQLNGHEKGVIGVYQYQCAHCGKGTNSHMGISRHHKIVHVNRRSDCAIQTALEGDCIKRNSNP